MLGILLMLAFMLVACGRGYDEAAVPDTVLLPGEQVTERWCYRTLGPPECYMEPQVGEANRLVVIEFEDEGTVAF